VRFAFMDSGKYTIHMSQLASERYSDRIAAGSLVLVQEVLNTRAAGKPPLDDLLASTDSAAAWLASALGEWSRRTGSPVPEIAVDDIGLERLQQLRAALQLHLTGAVRDAPSRPAPRGVGGSVDLAIDEYGELLAAPRGRDVGWVVGAVLNEVATAQGLGTLRRLKMCRNWACSVAFYDGTNNNNGVWHDVHICGNAINLRASSRGGRVGGVRLAGAAAVLAAASRRRAGWSGGAWFSPSRHGRSPTAPRG
jgi:hypothetical protein